MPMSDPFFFLGGGLTFIAGILNNNIKKIGCVSGIFFFGGERFRNNMSIALNIC